MASIETQLIRSASNLYSDSIEINICLSMGSSEDGRYWSIIWLDGLHEYSTKEFTRLHLAMKEYNRITGLPLNEWDKYKIKK